MPIKRAEKTAMPVREAQARAHDFKEVNEGYTASQAVFEAERCLRCQADLARYRRLRRTLAGLRLEHLPVPTDLLIEVDLELDEAADRWAREHRERRRAAYLGGLAAATAAGVGGVLVLAARGRRAAG